MSQRPTSRRQEFIARMAPYKGLRVTYSTYGLNTLQPRQKRTGTIVGISLDLSCANVRWDSKNSRESLAFQFLTVL